MAYHSKRSKVYHSLHKCPIGKSIRKKNRIIGTGGKKMCNFCKTAGVVFKAGGVVFVNEARKKGLPLDRKSLKRNRSKIVSKQSKKTKWRNK